MDGPEIQKTVEKAQLDRLLNSSLFWTWESSPDAFHFTYVHIGDPSHWVFLIQFQALPAYMERVQEDGVRLTEEELEERRQELLAKAEIQVSQNFWPKTMK